MRKSSKFAALALSAALAFGIAVPAFAAIDGQVNTPDVSKELNINPGSTVTATFGFDIKSTTIATGNGTDTLEGPALAIADVTFNNAEAGAEAKTAAITLENGDAITAEAFSSAGYYAYEITEIVGTGTSDDGIGEVQYNTTVKTYYLVIKVTNDGEVSYYAYDAKPESLTAEDNEKVDAIEFVNDYTETVDDNETDLTITKEITGASSDMTAEFEFTITFDADDVTVFPAAAYEDVEVADRANPTDAELTDLKAWVLAQIASEEATTEDDGATWSVTLGHEDEVHFTGIITGVNYTIEETVPDGWKEPVYDESDEGQVTEDGAEVTVTNEFQDITITGLFLNNAPFILMGAVAVAGVVLYGAAKRKLVA